MAGVRQSVHKNIRVTESNAQMEGNMTKPYMLKKISQSHSQILKKRPGRRGGGGGD